jgi:hypothetical protein
MFLMVFCMVLYVVIRICGWRLQDAGLGLFFPECLARRVILQVVNSLDAAIHVIPLAIPGCLAREFHSEPCQNPRQNADA